VEDTRRREFLALSGPSLFAPEWGIYGELAATASPSAPQPLRNSGAAGLALFFVRLLSPPRLQFSKTGAALRQAPSITHGRSAAR
ncbi:MAG: hypothetical protein WB421_06725, partial [Terriglobales bacterium]